MTNRVTLLCLDHEPQALPLLPKAEVAERVLDCIVNIWRGKRDAERS